MPKSLRSPLCWFPVLAVALFTLAGAAAAQQGVTSFKHFHRYPNGQWQQQGQGFRNGVPMGPVITDTTCSAPLSAAGVAAIKSLGNATAPQCTTRVLTDTEQLAESEQTCAMPGGTQVNRLTMHAVDDKTIRTEVRMSLNGQPMSEMRTTNRYQGTCTPEPVGAMPTMPKPSAEDCKEIAEMKQQAAESAKACAAASASERAGCEAVMQRMTKQVEQVSASCR